MNWRCQLTVTRDNPPSPRISEVRNLEINQSQSPKTRLTSRAGALTWKAVLLTLDQEHPTNLPEQRRNWSNTLEQHTVTAVSQTSWLKLCPPYPTHICLTSLIWSPSAQKQMEIWTTSRKRISMRTSTKRWGRRISKNQICTGYTISLRPNEQKTTREGGIGRHFPGSQDWPRPNRLPDDPKEDLLLKSVWTAPNPIIVPVYEASV